MTLSREFVPRPYQKIAIQKIIDNPFCGLFLRPGAGKTVSALTALKAIMHDMFDVRRCLIIAPLRVAQTVWAEECDEWSHLNGEFRIQKILGNEKQRCAALDDKTADVYIVNRENLKWLEGELRFRRSSKMFDMFIVDESTMFKNPDSARFKMMKRFRKVASRGVILTGTPAPRTIENLWSQVYVLDEGQRLGKSISQFRAERLLPDKCNGHVVYSYKEKPGEREKVLDAISDICLSIDSPTGVAEPIVCDRILKFPMHLAAEYLQFAQIAIMEAKDTGGAIVGSTAAVLRMKLIQFGNGLIYDDQKEPSHVHDLKLDNLGELIDELDGDPLLVFYNFKHDAERIVAKYGARPLKTICDIKDWNEGKIPVALAHPASAGHGLNLQYGGANICWFGLPDDLELYEQANARLARSGQTRQTFIHRIIMQGTIDELIVRSLASKGFSQQDIIDALLVEFDMV